jgi:hypothetical protein
MADRGSQIDMPHALSSHFGAGYLDAAFIADNTFVTYLLVLAAIALEVLGRAEYLLAEKAILLGLQSTIVESLGLGHLSIGPAPDLLR